jgi:hypothetical protein
MLEDKDKDVIKEIVAQNKEGFERLANEEPAKERRKNKVVRTARKYYRKWFVKEKDVGTIEV